MHPAGSFSKSLKTSNVHGIGETKTSEMVRGCSERFSMRCQAMPVHNLRSHQRKGKTA